MEHVRLRNTKISERMKELHNVSRESTQDYLKELVKEGLLENGELGYRPTDYYVEYSRAVPIFWMEKSPTFLSMPLSPYNWMTLHGFPELEEMTSDERKELFIALQELNERLGRLYLLRAAMAERLGRPQLAEDAASLRESLESVMSQAYYSPGSPALWPRGIGSDDELQDRVDQAYELGKRIWITEAWKNYVETPLVVSFSSLSHILKTVSPVRFAQPVSVNFQFHSYVYRLLEVASALWRAHLAKEGRDEKSIEKELKSRELDPDGIETKSMKICKSAFREVIRDRREYLDGFRERLNELVKRLEDLQEHSDGLRGLEVEVLTNYFARQWGPFAGTEFAEPMRKTLDSIRPPGVTFTRFQLKGAVNELIEDIDSEKKMLMDLNEKLYLAKEPRELTKLAWGLPAPSPEHLTKQGLDLMGFAKNHFPPSFNEDWS